MATRNLAITQGKTFALVLRWESDPVVFKAISSISQTAPARLGVVGHGLPDGWRVAVTNVKGMTAINAIANAIKASDYRKVAVIDPNTIDLVDVDASGFRAYTSGGYIKYNTPVSLTSFTARMSIKAKVATPALLKCAAAGASGTTKPTGAGVDGSVTWTSTTTGTPAKEWVAGAPYLLNDVIDLTDLYRLTTANGRILIDATKHTITLDIPATDTALMGWKSAVYDLELVSPDATPVVTSLLSGAVTVTREVTT